MPRVFCNEEGIVEETPEILEERTLSWYNPNYPISSLPYGIALPNGREAIKYTRNFNWHLVNLRYNRRVKWSSSMIKSLHARGIWCCDQGLTSHIQIR